MANDVLPVLFFGIDDAWDRLRARLEGLSDHEYLWEPVAHGWTVRPDGDRWLADDSDDDPQPAPVTTIAWRMWHIASFCLSSYVSPTLGEWPLAVTDREWFGEAQPALEALDVAMTTFRDRVMALGEDGIWQPLGPRWGPYADESWAKLVIHALDELAHHGAEVALLRDLYASRATP
jgi:hypothetical protein